MSEIPVGHKTFILEDGTVRHEPLYENEVDSIIKNIESQSARRHELMPDENTAIKMLFDAYVRLKELGWNDAIYCPKDGTCFDAIEAGSTGIGTCSYDGKWPKGTWWMHEAGDLWPSRPILYRVKAPEQ